MTDTVSLHHLLATGAHIATYEAVAIVQELLTTPGVGVEETAVQPEHVMLCADGAVRYRGGLPSAESLGHLLDAMLPPGQGTRVSGSLRFTIARACGSVVAPPLASRPALSSALERFESGPRDEAVRNLLARTGLVVGALAQSANPGTPASAAPVRRSLPAAAVSSRARWVMVAIAAVLASFGAGYAATGLVLRAPVDVTRLAAILGN